MKTNTIHTGDCLEVLESLPDESVHCVMTSPPYWNLRDYGHDDQLGLEAESDDYVQNITDVMDKVQEVLRDDGSLWLNLGDTYDDKDLQQIPARVALELQNRGWILRNRVTWAKPDPMPQSVKDRLNDTTEAIFHFVKRKDYYYDLDAIRVEYKHREAFEGAKEIGGEGNKIAPKDNHNKFHSRQDIADTFHDKGKNPGDLFEETTAKCSEAHFAVYPPELCEKPIKATCSEDGVVLDPFAGAGTTLLKAKELGRDYVGIELNPEYADMARARIGLSPHDPSNVRDSEEQSGLEAYAGGD